MNIRLVIVRILSMFFICFAFNGAKAADTNELIRASIIEKVVRFIEWPAWTDEQFSLCVADKTPLLSAIQTYYASSSLNNKPVNVLIFNEKEKIVDCQAIYLDEEQTNDLSAILKITSNRPILIVAEKKDAVSHGAHLGFFIEDDRLQLEVNRKMLTSSGFKVSYHLLQVARIVD
ncbi:MAG: YfiR family protein [Gammaproteobacteria bacterium]